MKENRTQSGEIVMEVPDRLYLSHLIYETYQYQIPDPDDDTEIEYVRKDAFVKKTIKYIANHFLHQEWIMKLRTLKTI